MYAIRAPWRRMINRVAGVGLGAAILFGGLPADVATASAAPIPAAAMAPVSHPGKELVPRPSWALRALALPATEIDYPMKRTQSVYVAPRTSSAKMGTVFLNEAVRIVCYSNGSEVEGSKLWAEIRYFVDGSNASNIKQGWVPDVYVRTGRNGRLPGIPTGNCPPPFTEPQSARPGDPGTPSHPRDSERGAIPISPPVLDCGFFVCDSYLTRSTTRYIANRLEPLQNESNAVIGAAAAGACFATGAGAIVSPICGVVGVAYGRYFTSQLLAARDNNACVMFRHKNFLNVAAPGFPPVIHVRNNTLCHN